MNLRGSVSHPFRIFSIPVHGLGRTIPFLGGARNGRKVCSCLSPSPFSSWTASSRARRRVDLSVSKRTHPGNRASTNYPLRKTSKWARNGLGVARFDTLLSPDYFGPVSIHTPTRLVVLSRCGHVHANAHVEAAAARPKTKICTL